MLSSNLPSVTYGDATRSSSPSSTGLDAAMFLKFWTMGVFMASIAYGIALTLSISTIYLLHKSSRNKKERRHYVLILYVLFMIFLATVSISCGIDSNLAAIQGTKIPSNMNNIKDENAIIVVVVIWCSDGFLLWRAAVLYEGIETLKRKLVRTMIGFLMFAQILCGILNISFTFIKALSSTQYSRPVFISFASTTLTVNWIITGMVIFRIGQYRDHVSSWLGKSYGGPFRRIIVMCIESAVLIIVFSSIFLIQNLRGSSPFSLSRLLLVQIYVVAPLLTLYRVVQGKACPSNTPSNFSFNVSGSTENSIRENSTTPGLQEPQEGAMRTSLSAQTDEVTNTHDIHEASYVDSDVEIGRIDIT